MTDSTKSESAWQDWDARPVVQATAYGTVYVTCPDHPNVCTHSKGECPADKQATEQRTASFKRIG